jgi:SAM-dependent methyltransferase
MDPVPTPQELAKLYADDYADSGHLPDAAFLDEIHVRQRHFALGLIRRHCPAGPVLELGPGYGHFLRTLREAGIPAVGLEGSRTLARRLREAGFDVIQGLAEGLPAGIGPFGGVYMSNVFEHLGDPERVLRQLESVLEPGGCVITVQPTAYLGPLLARLYLLLFPRRTVPDLGTWLATPYHILLISPQGMEALCARVGLTLLEVHPVPTEDRRGPVEWVGRALNAVNRIGVRLTWRWPLVPSHCFVIGKPGPVRPLWSGQGATATLVGTAARAGLRR